MNPKDLESFLDLAVKNTTLVNRDILSWPYWVERKGCLLFDDCDWGSHYISNYSIFFYCIVCYYSFLTHGSLSSMFSHNFCIVLIPKISMRWVFMHTTATGAPRQSLLLGLLRFCTTFSVSCTFYFLALWIYEKQTYCNF